MLLERNCAATLYVNSTYPGSTHHSDLVAESLVAAKRKLCPLWNTITAETTIRRRAQDPDIFHASSFTFNTPFSFF